MDASWDARKINDDWWFQQPRYPVHKPMETTRRRESGIHVDSKGWPHRVRAEVEIQYEIGPSR